MTQETEVAIVTKLFTRSAKLRQLLQSVPDLVDTVYVADDGPIPADDRDVYSVADSFDYELEVIDLPEDAGLGRGRKEIVEASDEEYLFLLDSDMEVPENAEVLVDILDASPEFGGIGGLLDEDGEQIGLCHDLRETTTAAGELLVRTNTNRPAETHAGHEVRPFDFIPNAALFRRECVEEYCWDEEYVIGREHLDFYVGHWKQTDWRFGAAPEVAIPHYPGGSSGYLSERHNMKKISKSKRYFREKWGYETVIHESDWFGVGSDNPFRPLPSPPLPLTAKVAAKRVREQVDRALQGVF